MIKEIKAEYKKRFGRLIKSYRIEEYRLVLELNESIYSKYEDDVELFSNGACKAFGFTYWYINKANSTLNQIFTSSVPIKIEEKRIKVNRDIIKFFS